MYGARLVWWDSCGRYFVTKLHMNSCCVWRANELLTLPLYHERFGARAPTSELMPRNDPGFPPSGSILQFQAARMACATSCLRCAAHSPVPGAPPVNGIHIINTHPRKKRRQHDTVFIRVFLLLVSGK